MFQLTFLGTSAGVPTKHRNVTALAVECLNPYLDKDKQRSKSKRPWVLIDCGEGTQHQLLHTKLSVNQLVAIGITHVHGDHCYGLPGLLASMAMNGRKDKLTLIAPKALTKFLDALTIATELYFNYPIEFIAVEDMVSHKVEESGVERVGSENNRLTLDLSPNHCLAIKVTALSHRVPSYAFGLTQTVTTRRLKVDKLQENGIPAGAIWGKLQQGQDIELDVETAKKLGIQTLKAENYIEHVSLTTKMVVAGDNDNPSLLKEAVQEASLLVHEATYTQAISDSINARPDSFDPMHTSAQKIACFAESIKLPSLILTHFSARYQPFDNPSAKSANMSDIRLEAEQFYKGDLWLASDFAAFEVNGDGVTKLSL